MMFSKANSKPITLMFIIDTYISMPNDSLNGGTEKQLYLLASSIDPERFKPIIVQLSPETSLAVAKGHIGNLELFHYPTRKLYGLGGLRQLGRLRSLAKKNRVDIIHTFFEKSEVMGWLTARLSGIPVWITSRRDLGFKRKGIYDRIFRLTSKDCKKCVANCNAVREQAIQQENLLPEKIEVIYNGLDLSEYQQTLENESLREELKVVKGVPLVGLIANFNFEIKGHIYFLGAAKKILEKIPEVKFVLVGDGPLRSRYEEVARELRIHRNVYFLGKRTDVPSIISNLDVSVLSSTNEGFSNVIMESMAAGKPVVATNVGGSKEMVIDGVTGCLVPPADSQSLANAIIDLLETPDKAMAMGSAGREVVKERFTVDTMVKKYEELYQSLIYEYDIK
jgi:glycosyltransferase involved in cell wall biosynthesis